VYQIHFNFSAAEWQRQQWRQTKSERQKDKANASESSRSPIQVPKIMTFHNASRKPTATVEFSSVEFG